jgi:hypothetical protein
VEVAFYVADLNLTGDAYQFSSQIKLGMLTVKAIETRHEHRRNHEDGIGIVIRIADHKPRT